MAKKVMNVQMFEINYEISNVINNAHQDGRKNVFHPPCYTPIVLHSSHF